MQDQFELIRQFFNLRHKCPICGNYLLREAHSKFKDGNRRLYQSNFKNDIHDYENFVFIKNQLPITENQIEEDKKNDNYVDSSPSIINLKEVSPPNINFLTFNSTNLVCYNRGIEYELWAGAPHFEPRAERFIYNGFDITIKPKEIINYGAVDILMSKNMILKFTPQEAVTFVKKMMVLQ